MTISVGQAFERLLGDDARVRVVAWDGSTSGAADSAADCVTVRLRSPQALNYLLTAPGELGMVRAYLQDELTIDGMDEGDPYEVLKNLRAATLSPRLPSLRDVPELVQMVRSSGVHLPELPPQETPGQLRRLRMPQVYAVLAALAVRLGGLRLDPTGGGTGSVGTRTRSTITTTSGTSSTSTCSARR